MIDVVTLRKDFPMLQQTMRGKPFIYLDNGATSLKPYQVIRAEMEYYERFGVNIHRGLYEFSERATRIFAEARSKVAHFINAHEDAEVIFTHGSTESSNLVSYSWGRKFLKEGDIVLSTDIEHHSNLVPWQAACLSTGAQLRFIPLLKTNQEIDMEEFERMLSSGVRLVVISAMANATGYMIPLADVIKAAHRHGALVCVDGAQYVSHHPIDVQSLDCDFLTFSAHKMLGPTGVGVLYGKRTLLESMDPFMYGGDMILEVHRHATTYQGIPEKFEAGTPNIGGVIAFSAALDYLERVGMSNIAEWERSLLDHCMLKLAERPWITRYGPTPMRCGGILSFNVEGIHSHDIGTLLDGQGIAVRTGFHCAMPYMSQLGVSGTIRASWYLYNTKEDIDRLFEGVDQARALFLA